MSPRVGAAGHGLEPAAWQPERPGSRTPGLRHRGRSRRRRPRPERHRGPSRRAPGPGAGRACGRSGTPAGIRMLKRPSPASAALGRSAPRSAPTRPSRAGPDPLADAAGPRADPEPAADRPGPAPARGPDQPESTDRAGSVRTGRRPARASQSASPSSPWPRTRRTRRRRQPPAPSRPLTPAQHRRSSSASSSASRSAVLRAIGLGGRARSPRQRVAGRLAAKDCSYS